MVKLTAPLGSIAAHGKLADTLIFQSSGPSTVVKTFKKPANPRSPAQTGLRTMMAAMNQQWKLLTPDQKATWEPPTDDPTLTPSNNFKSINLARWANFKGPSKSKPATEDDDDVAFLTFNLTCTANQITLQIYFNVPRQNWLLTFHRTQNPTMVANYDNCVHIFQNPAIGTTYRTLPPLPQGTYYYRVQTITNGGRIRARDLTNQLIVPPL